MNALYRFRRKYIVETEMYIDDILKGIETLSSNKDCKDLTKALVQSIHNIVCTERISREDLVKIKKVAKDLKEEFLEKDCDARLRNLAAN